MVRAFMQSSGRALTCLLLQICVAAVTLASPVQRPPAPAPETAPHGAYDLWIRNGTVIDGTGRDRYLADVLVKGDTIAYIGKFAERTVTARRIIDAGGKVVVPGFIDAHAHGDPLSQSFLNFLSQGITTVLLGQDGETPSFDPEGPPESLGHWMQRVDRHGSEVNIATLSGHGSLRLQAGVGDASQPTVEQLAHMKQILSQDLASGAYGLSFGLEYAPGRYAQVPEEKALGDLIGRQHGIVMSHLRSEDSDKISSAIDELLQIDAHVHVSHIKIVGGHRVEEADAVLTQLARGRRANREVTADVYPYMASASNFVFLYPEWAKRRSDYEEAVKHRRPELEAYIRKRVGERNGPAAILITDGRYAGSTLAQVAARLGKPYTAVMIDTLGYGGPAQAHFIMAQAIQERFFFADDVCISTDGAPASTHPRSAGSFSKILEDYVGPPPKMSLERAVFKMSGLTARILGLAGRGTLAEGAKADILVIRPDEVHNQASWTKPMLPPTGFDVVVVNGSVAYEAGHADGHLHGRVLRRTKHLSQSQ